MPPSHDLKLLSNDAKVIHDRVDIREIAPMTDRDYQVDGRTALMDALGGAIHHIVNIHKYARPEDVPEICTIRNTSRICF